MLTKHKCNFSGRHVCNYRKLEDGICAGARRARLSNMKNLKKELTKLIYKNRVPAGFNYFGCTDPADALYKVELVISRLAAL